MSDKIPIKPHNHCLFCYLQNSGEQSPPLVTYEHLLLEHPELGFGSLESYHRLVDLLVINDHFVFTPFFDQRLRDNKYIKNCDPAVDSIVNRILGLITTHLPNKNPREQVACALQIETFVQNHFECVENRLPPEAECDKIILNEFGYFEKEFTNHHVMIYIPEIRFSGTGEILPGYWIDKYPVINFQFCKLIKSKKLINSKRNHPIVNVDWSEVQEYCERVKLRLPNEMEWEQAATGGDGRWYPWGGAFDPDKCNTFESQINDSCSVTGHPGGASPYGVMDLLGNVWEWCLPISDIDSGWMVLRGGSWNNTGSSISCSVRMKTPRTAKNQNVGFRCARAPD